MTIDNVGDSVGKKIVEALKFQDDSNNTSDYITEDLGMQDDNSQEFDMSIKEEPSMNSNIDTIFQNNLNQSINPQFGMFQNSIPNDVELPANVAILNKLVAKLPVGVSRQTGALIIKQTMEALGISMQSVIAEAKQVQENLTHRAAECQQNIIDYKKQIGLLEQQSLQYQRQAVVMNDMINLFVNSGNA